MLTRNQLAKIANQSRVSLGTQERDYIQHLFLYLLYTKTQEFIFKGGTALRVAYGFNRFSEDLDFNSHLASQKVRKVISETIRELVGFGVRGELRRIKVFRENGERALTGDLSFEGPLFVGKPESKGKVRVDVSLRGEDAKTKRVVVPSKYDDVPQFVLNVLSIDEIFAEKIRALLIRGKPRDLYDTWVLLGGGVKLDYELINKKLALYKKKFDFEEFGAKLDEAKGGWKTDLSPLLPQVTHFEEVKEVVIEAFA